MLRAVAAVALVALLAGCLSTTVEQEPISVDDPCPTATPTSAVAGFTIHNGNWTRTTTQGGGVGPICGEGNQALNSLVDSSSTVYTNFEATGMFQLLERDALEGDAGAGMVIHFADDNNFQIIRYSPREQGWHLFTMTDGVRQKQGSASVTPPTTNPAPMQWVSLRIVSQDGNVTAYHDSVKVIDYTLPAGAPLAGRVGFFLRSEQAAYFDQLTVTAL